MYDFQADSCSTFENYKRRKGRRKENQNADRERGTEVEGEGQGEKRINLCTKNEAAEEGLFIPKYLLLIHSSFDTKPEQHNSIVFHYILNTLPKQYITLV